MNVRTDSAFTDKVDRNCHLPSSDWNCMTHCQGLQGFSDTNQASVREDNNGKLFFYGS
jgi:hypothetical protein